MEDEIYKAKLNKYSEKLKALGHPARLCIVCRLMKRDCNVSKMQSCLDLPQSTVSQHLAVLKSRGIVQGKRSGVEMVYSIADDDVKKIINALFKPEEIPDTE